MAVFQIGRLFADYDVDIKTSSWAGSRWSVSGDVVLTGATRADQGIAVREQILAMDGNPDEPFVAVQWSEEPTVDGFYWLAGIRCDIGQMHLTDGLLSWSAELERVGSSPVPSIESHCSWQLVTNTRSVISPTTFLLRQPRQFAVPGGAFDLGPVSGTVSGGASNVTGPTNLATGFGSILGVDAVSIPATGIMGWSVDPSGYYDGNCLVTTDFGAATDQKVFGRRSDRSTDWVVSNGMVRFSVEPTNKRLRVEHWDSGSAAWVRANSTDYVFSLVAGAATFNYVAMTVLRNAPECVAVRLAYHIPISPHPYLRGYVDLMILRGGSMVYGYISTVPEISGWQSLTTMRIATSPAVASTAVTGGFRATSADANGNQFVLVTGAPACTDTLASGLTTTTGNTNSLSFGISASTWATFGNVENAALEFFARRSETARIVDR